MARGDADDGRAHGGLFTEHLDETARDISVADQQQLERQTLALPAI